MNLAWTDLEENLWPPRLAGGGIGLEEAETSSGGIKLVHIGIADMVVRLSLELRLYLGELVFQHGEVDADVMLGPELLLVPDRTVRTAPDKVSQGLRVAHHVHGDDTGGITHFECPIDVKANELGQACVSCVRAGDRQLCRFSVWIMPSRASSCKLLCIQPAR
jgi:hypothetical protein